MTRKSDPTIQSYPTSDVTIADGDEAFCSACNQSFPMDVERCPHDGARLTKLLARPDALLGRVFDGRYEIRAALGAGGMGTVYRGWQISVDREVAIKVIHQKLASDRTVVKRFLREARLSSRLSQPNIVNVYDFGQTDDGILYLVMELIRGRTLSKDLDAQRPLPLKRVTTIATQLCDALEAAHGQGIVHRDLKPGNIMILDEPPGRDLLKVLDFGLSKSLVNDTTSLVTHSSSLLGTPLYMSPEQIEGKPSDQRGDLYSLGCILYQMVSGLPPYHGTSINLVLQSHLTEPPAPLPATVPPSFARLIVQLIEKQPDRRPANAGLVRDAIQQLVDGGISQVDLADTTPEIRTGAHERARSPIALAMTMPHGTTEVHAPVRAKRTSWWKTLGIALSLASAGVVALVVMSSSTGTKDASRPSASMGGSGSGAVKMGVIGSQPAPPPDAAVDAVVADAPVAIDAAPPAQRPAAKRVVVPTIAIDAGVVATPVDAPPAALDLPLLRTQRGSGN